jgi:nucleotide-binding universal stress UspA family protein
MPLIESVLFPVDFSRSSVAMAGFVTRAASLFHARITLLHVLDPASFNGMELYLRSPLEIAEDHWIIARERLDNFLPHSFPLESCERLVAEGDPAEEIARVANERGVGLIVMPTHSGRFRQMLLGSTTAKVLNDAHCPVLTSHHAETIVPRPLEHRQWLAALALTPDAERVLRFAASAAQQLNGKLSILHAIQSTDPTLEISMDLAGQLHAVEREEARQRFMALQRSLGVDYPIQVAVGNVKAALVEAARLAEADALVIGRSPDRGHRGRLRDLTYAMVRDSPVPVLSV